MRVLIVEDEEESAELLAMTVRQAGHEVRVASDGMAGVQAADAFRPHLILTDYMMPNANGLEVLRRIKAVDPNAFVVMLTAFGGENVAVEALRGGAANYLKKPVRGEALLEIIGKFDRIVRSRETAQRLTTFIEETCLHVALPNEPPLVSPLVERLTALVVEIQPQADLNSLHLGLEEMIRNGMEHGNLEIGFEEKEEALRNASMLELMDSRNRDPRLGARRIRVHVHVTRSEFRCVVEDEGAGFDWKRQLTYDPLSDENLHRLNGRGIFLTRSYFDEVNYSGNGNRVELVKRIAQ